MELMDVLVVRIYITEGSKLLEQLLNYLKNETKINGVSVFRAIHGFGTSKTEHSAALVDLSLDLPIAIEFFDEVLKVNQILEHLSTTFKLDHIVSWHAKAVISSQS